MTRVKSSVVNLKSYRVAQDSAVVKLNQNESPIDVPDKVKRETSRRLRELNWNRYPTSPPDSLAGRIADYTSFASAGIVVGNGSNELIQMVIQATCDSGDTILVVEPGFSVYERVASIMNINIRRVPLNGDLSFDPPSIIDAAKAAKLIILASPNNPTGTALNLDAVEEIATAGDCILGVDEAYYEFHRQSAQKLIDRLDNVVVIRTFSKALSLAGIRLGYLLGNERIVEQLEKAKLPFSVGIFQQVAGEVILENVEFIRDNVERIVRERDRLLAELKEVDGVIPYPSRTNFILFEVKGVEAGELLQALYAKGVLLRSFDGPRLRNMLRVTVGLPEENDVFLDRLSQEIEGRRV